MSERLPVSELLRLACIYAESHQSEFLDAIADCKEPSDVEAHRQTIAFIEQVREYRLRRWGRTRLEATMAEMKSVPVTELMKGHRHE